MPEKAAEFWRRGRHRAFDELPERDTDANRTGVAYISVLFGIVVGQLAIGSVKPVKALFGGPVYHASGPSAAHYFVGLVLTVTSFVGYFASKNGPQLRIKFFNLPFVQIFLDSCMVILYFFVAVYAEDGSRLSHPSALPEAILICVSFFLYVLWDVIGWRLRRHPLSQLALGRAPIGTYGGRRWVTIGFFTASFCVVAWLAWIAPRRPSDAFVIWSDVGLVVLLIIYRVAKSIWDSDIRYEHEHWQAPKHEPAQSTVQADDWEHVVPAAVRDNRLLLAHVVRDGVRQFEAKDAAAMERLRQAGAVIIEWNEEHETHQSARATEAGQAYIELRTDP